MCMHSGPDSDNGHRKKWRKCVQITRAKITTTTNAKLLLTTITTKNNNNKNMHSDTLQRFICSQHSSLLSLYLPLSPFFSHSSSITLSLWPPLSPTLLSALFCTLLRLLLPDALFALLFTLCRPSLPPRLSPPPHFGVVLTGNCDSVKFALSAQWKVTRNSAARARQ